MSTQLVLMECDGAAYYGEFSDAHIFRCAERNIVLEDLVSIPIPADWKTYLDKLSFMNIEQADGTWVRMMLRKHTRAVQSSSGYIMPIIELVGRDAAKAFNKILRRCDIQPPVQGRAPSAVVRSTQAVKKQVIFRNEIISDNPRNNRVRRSSISSTDAVSGKLLS